VNVVATWTPEELDHIGQAEELHLAAVQGDIDSAYHAKYDRYGPRIVGSVTGPEPRAVTVRLHKAGRQDPDK
jgi:Uncharacterized protein conserved in bacteria (DUF2255)